jgi:hypothetical protein
MHCRNKNIHRKQVSNSNPMWFNMSNTKITPEVESDLRLISMRDYIDPKRHYKRLDRKNPQLFQIGTIIDDPTDFYRRTSKKSITDTVLSDQRTRKYLKKKYGEIQNSKLGGKNRRARK